MPIRALGALMDDDEAYILLLLADGNLPTGSFVASSGLESYIKHGFSASQPESLLNFIRDSLSTYTRSALPFMSDAHRITGELYQSKDTNIEQALADIVELDRLYEAMTLNHVARRASQSQGVALLALYSKGLSRPKWMPSLSEHEKDRESRLTGFIDRLKLMVRKEDTSGHLPVCWGVLTGALGLTLERSQYLHIFLHARSLLSAAVRLNTIGPYGAQQLLLHAVRPLADLEASRCKNLRTGIPRGGFTFDELSQGPATTWPLGEILATRHDIQHSRIFNS